MMVALRARDQHNLQSDDDKPAQWRRLTEYSHFRIISFLPFSRAQILSDEICQSTLYYGVPWQLILYAQCIIGNIASPASEAQNIL